MDERDRRAITALRVLAVDQVEGARSGHPGLPLGVAPMAYVLWSRFLMHDPTDPRWPNRDRFVLSAGHGSALLYALLHLFGYDLPMAELRAFRQWDSRTPGHPEHGLTPGVETTTGPLGQGFATAVGMALAERHLAARFNRESYPVMHHRTWVIASDGDLMEGVAHEAAALAGHWKLGHLVVLYDDNRITIEGATSLAWSEDVEARFAALGWRTVAIEDGNDPEAIASGLENAASTDEAPVLVRIRTHIGHGSPHKQDSPEAHGAPLGPEEATLTRRNLGWTIDEPFTIPEDLAAHVRSFTVAGTEAHRRWDDLMQAYRADHGAAAAELERRLAGRLPEGWERSLPDFTGDTGLATRQASGKVLNALAATIPELLGGSADLAPSNNTVLKGEGSIGPSSFAGRNVHFGVREHAMGAICNGLALHGGIRPYAGTFLIFSDYMRPSIRLAALMHQPVVYIFTHDSVALGEDGPTHQPVEHLAALRAIPNLLVLRPADAWETSASWRIALARRDGPTVLALSRQKLPVLPRITEGAVSRGAFVRAEAEGGEPEVVLLASGSEVALALAARSLLGVEGIPTRVVSVPSLELFNQQDDSYRAAVLGHAEALRVAVEMGRGQGWGALVAGGLVLSLERFGASAPGDEVARRLGFSPEAVAERIRGRLASRRVSRLAAAVPPAWEGVLAGKYARLESLHTLERLTARDATLWGERTAADACRRMGWLDLPSRTTGDVPMLRRLVDGLTREGVRTLYLLGMGGSALAPRVLHEVLGAPSGRALAVVDTIDPETIEALVAAVDPATSAVLAVSKSGGTVETLALLEVFWRRLHDELGSGAGQRFMALTENATPLAQLAEERGFRKLISHHTDVGGRYAALGAVGVLPSLWLGHDVDALLRSGRRALEGFDPRHPGVELAALTGAAAAAGWGVLAWCASPGLAPLGAWMEQLVAESTGKLGRGVLPVWCRRPPLPEAAWRSTLYLSPRLAGEDTTDLDKALDALAEAGHPVVRWRLRSDAIGEGMAALEVATALTGLFLGVNPFDEPDVVRAKERARAALAHPPAMPPVQSKEPVRQLLDHLQLFPQARAIALLAYLPETGEPASLLSDIEDSLRARLRIPVTAAFGPRYLHSTGQLHKGGPAGIVPVLLSSDPPRDLQVPGRRFTFGQLRLAQAMGDLAALRDVGRDPLHLHLGGEPAVLLREILAAVRG